LLYSGAAYLLAVEAPGEGRLATVTGTRSIAEDVAMGFAADGDVSGDGVLVL
jgi:hypothetical protein